MYEHFTGLILVLFCTSVYFEYLAKAMCIFVGHACAAFMSIMYLNLLKKQFGTQSILVLQADSEAKARSVVGSTFIIIK